jgi:hypothetical protein
MNLRQRMTLAHGLTAHTDRPAMSAGADHQWATGIAASLAFLFLLAAVDYRDELLAARAELRTVAECSR